MGLRGIGAKPIKPGAKPPRRRTSWRKAGLSRADRLCKFIESLTISSGSHAGRKFRLRPWQREIITAIYRTDENGRRIVRQALITVPRKNGKTQLSAALALCHLAGPEAISRGQIYSAAADRGQATLTMREMVALIRADDELSERIIIREHAKTLEDIETRSTYGALSSDARKAHGLSVSFGVCDEVAQWHGRDLYDNLITGTGAHDEPLLVAISTMSHNPDHVMSELVRYGQRVNAGEIEDPAFHATIYAADEKADPWSEETWHAANPALGDFRSLDEMRIAAEQAKRLPAREPSFRLLYLNQPIDAASHFLTAPDWRACIAEIDPAALFGKRCILGLDLSSTTDLTALAAYFPTGGELLMWFFYPEGQLEEAEKRDHVPYRLWARQGFLETCPGRAIDKGFVVRRMAELVADYKVEACAYDRWGIHELKRILADEGVKLEMVEWGQGWKDSSPALAAMETAVLQGQLRHADHPVMRMCVGNAVALTDPAGGRKLAKDRSTGRIDGLVAACMALGLAARQAPKRASVYATRGVLTVSP
ncbi:MAG: terminase large subunit [Rhizobiales bacterium]|nr:terminase large subunit [Hyphomicrobiales bacterium]